VLVKAGLDALQDEIQKAVDAAREHWGRGLHLRDSGRATYPTISPREGDLLRRAAAQQSSIGLDLKWWSADPYGGTGAGSDKSWTKVLVGRFLFGGDAPSRLNFFKLVPRTGAEHTVESAKRMQSKLLHIKVNAAIVSGARALMITERVGSGNIPPISLGEFLSTTIASNAGVLAAIVGQIRDQLVALGEVGPQIRAVKDLVWKWHDVPQVRAEWEKVRDVAAQKVGGPGQDPVELLSQLTVCSESVRIEFQSMVHGGLHLSNVAVDVISEVAEAYIFDCAGLSGHVAFRDLAQLEVSALLHQDVIDGGFVWFCRAFYQSFLPADLPPEEAQRAQPVLLNTWMFIRHVRAAVGSHNQRLYALLVFDYAMAQLGGLAFGLSQNKIGDPGEVALLVALTARWYQRLESDTSRNSAESPVL
jgi:hypothetical protein